MCVVLPKDQVQAKSLDKGSTLRWLSILDDFHHFMYCENRRFYWKPVLWLFSDSLTVFGVKPAAFSSENIFQHWSQTVQQGTFTVFQIVHKKLKRWMKRLKQSPIWSHWHKNTDRQGEELFSRSRNSRNIKKFRFFVDSEFEGGSGLPDGLFLNQKFQFR
jgi:glutathione S-transferase